MTNVVKAKSCDSQFCNCSRINQILIRGCSMICIYKLHKCETREVRPRAMGRVAGHVGGASDPCFLSL